MKGFVGIDLGTTFSVLSVIDETGRPLIVPNRDDENITPSCVDERAAAFRVGTAARATWGVSGGNSSGRAAARFKRDMGTAMQFHINDHVFSATQLSAIVLRKLVLDAKDRGVEADEAVVTIPANFPNTAREATMEAAKTAGLQIRHIINEPTAAALYYAYTQNEPLAGNYAVYDLGGGTFDVSIIRMHGRVMDVLASNGLPRLGGYDFDQLLRDIVEQKYEAQAGAPMRSSDFTLNDAEAMKIRLSEKEKDDVDVGRGGGGELIEVRREELEAVIAPMISRAELLCETTLQEAGITINELQGVLFVGGATRMPLVRESARRVFRREPFADAKVDEAVALGAALYALYKGDRKTQTPAQRATIDKISVSESTSKCFGTIAMTYSSQRDEAVRVNDILIPKGTRIPYATTRSYLTVQTNQQLIRCRITESEQTETDPKLVTVLKEVEMDLPPGRAAKQEIKVTYAYDENQIMHCSFVDVISGRERGVSLSMVAARPEKPFAIERYMVE